MVLVLFLVNDSRFLGKLVQLGMMDTWTGDHRLGSMVVRVGCWGIKCDRWD